MRDLRIHPVVQRLSQHNRLALFGAPFLWISTEVFRAYLPNQFSLGIARLSGRGNPALLQLTTITGIYGVSFLVAGYNSLLIWILSSPPEKRKSRLMVVAAVLVILLTVQAFGPRFVPSASASHLARVVQPNFPENMQYAGDWYADHKADMAELEQLSLRRCPGEQQPLPVMA
jgi:apolipoprotein N-acyltransferase